MATFLTIYFSGAYITLILYSLLLNKESFRDYVCDIIDALFILLNKDKGNNHIYSYLKPFAFILSAFSWLGFITVLTLMIDYCSTKIKHDED